MEIISKSLIYFKVIIRVKLVNDVKICATVSHGEVLVGGVQMSGSDQWARLPNSLLFRHILSVLFFFFLKKSRPPHNPPKYF